MLTTTFMKKPKPKSNSKHACKLSQHSDSSGFMRKHSRSDISVRWEFDPSNLHHFPRNFSMLYFKMLATTFMKTSKPKSDSKHTCKLKQDSDSKQFMRKQWCKSRKWIPNLPLDLTNGSTPATDELLLSRPLSLSPSLGRILSLSLSLSLSLFGYIYLHAILFCMGDKWQKWENKWQGWRQVLEDMQGGLGPATLGPPLGLVDSPLLWA